MLKANLQSISLAAIPTAYRTSACAGHIFAGKINFKFVAAVLILYSTSTPPKPSCSSNGNGYSLVFLPYLHLRVLSLIQPCIYQTLVSSATAEPISSSSSDFDLHDLQVYPPRSVKSGWITISNTALYIMSCPHFFRDN